MRVRPRPIAVAGALLAATLAARPADAYVRSVSDAGDQLYWSTSCETVTVYLNGFSQMTPDEVATAVGAAAAAWGPTGVTCPSAGGAGDGGGGHPYFEILPELDATSVPPGAAVDGKNTIFFRRIAGSFYGDVPLAFTTTSKEPDGHVIDADIQINTDPTIAWANLGPNSPVTDKNGIPLFDLQTVLTHEFGHFLGLAHSCSGGGSDDGSSQPPGGLGADGLPLPACADDYVPQAASVMWATIEGVKRDLDADDAAGVCAIYPAAQDPHSCTQNSPDDGCGCAAAGTRGGGLTALALGALALAATRRRGRARRRR